VRGWLNSSSLRTPPNSMTKLSFHDFLVEHAKFPFPDTSVGGSASSTDINEVDVGRILDQWRAVHAVRDDNLAEKLCDALKTTLGQTSLTKGLKHSLLPCFLSTSGSGGLVGSSWEDNPNESHVSVILVPCGFKLNLRGRARCY